ncbi:MAG: bifunctional pyr operon transcriptional regulator/uracil phosphoribosyltransferase PyrR [Cytophagaceae bacterium]|jgi:pyrimidine operon attenuation protein/uracil phosphoribosyltransferase|nr:bifunctional pyr operon transcriptional regulator/uracil phosphoribosyltransferase PyrR [Cytophagaceae bacterium]
MSKRIIIDNDLLQIMLDRLCQQLIESHDTFSDSVLIALQPRGVTLGNRIQKKLSKMVKKEIPLGYLDVTFFRDDFRRNESLIKANATNVPFLIEDKKVILIDDVLYTGRTIRAAMDAMLAFGRPKKVELLSLINRKYSRDMPIQPTFVGKEVICLESEKVLVELSPQEGGKDTIWLVKK